MYTILIFFLALIYTVHCNPLGQTTVCESAQNYPGITTVIGSSPNFPYYPYSFPLAGLGAAELLPLLSGTLGLPGLANPVLGSTTVVESAPNVLGLGGIGELAGFGLNSLYGLPLGYPYGLSNLANLMGVGPLGGAGTICESTSNVLGPLGLPLPLGGLGLGNLGLGGLGLNGLNMFI